MEQTKPFVEQAKLEIGNELYRMVLTGDAYWSVNDGFLFGAAGMDSYTSVERESTHDIAARLGYYTDESFGIHYKSGSTLARESLLGVKYLIASEMPQTGYETVMEKDNLALYRNKYAFPFAWLADEKILNVADESGDLFAYQNRIFETLYQKEEGQTETGADGETDAESGKNAGEVLQPVKGELAQVEGCEQLADGAYQMAEDAEFGYIVYQPHPEKTGELYFEPSDWGTAKIGVWLNEKEIDFSNQESPVKRLGIVKAGDDVSLRTVLVPGVTFKSDGAGVYMENEMQLAQSADIVENQNVRIERKKDTEIHIFCENPSAEEKYLVCMLPMDEGWKISVDGEKVQAVPVMGNVTAIPLAPGTHEVSMKFVLRGWNMGWCVTVVTFVLVCGPEFVRKMRKVN